MSSQLVPQDIVPITSGYIILMAVLAAGLRLDRRASGDGEAGAAAGADHAAAPADTAAGRADTAAGPADDLEDGARGRGPSRFARRFPPGWPRLAAHVVGTAVGGYVLLMAIVLLYYYGVARVANQFLDSAFTGSALLLAVTLPCFAVLSWLAEYRKRRRQHAPATSRRGAGDQPPPAARRE